MEPAEVLKDLAEDLTNGQYADKERAVAMLSSMTMYIDHHDVLLESGVLPALLRTVSSSKIEPTVSLIWHACSPLPTFVHHLSIHHFHHFDTFVPMWSTHRQLAAAKCVALQVRVVALGCTADLFKSPDAQNYLAAHPDFLQILVQCMQVSITTSCTKPVWQCECYSTINQLDNVSLLKVANTTVHTLIALRLPLLPHASMSCNLALRCLNVAKTVLYSMGLTDGTAVPVICGHACRVKTAGILAQRRVV